MSLDVMLIDEYGGHVYEANITHNLCEMADAAGIYKCLWRPDEIGVTHAHQLIEPLTAGVIKLVTDSRKYEAMNSPNGWGKWEHFVPFVARYLQACKDHPDATVRVWR